MGKRLELISTVIFWTVLKIQRDTSNFVIALSVRLLVSTWTCTHSWTTGPTTHYRNDTCSSIHINILMDEKGWEVIIHVSVGAWVWERERERERNVDCEILSSPPSISLSWSQWQLINGHGRGDATYDWINADSGLITFNRRRLSNVGYTIIYNCIHDTLACYTCLAYIDFSSSLIASDFLYVFSWWKYLR